MKVDKNIPIEQCCGPIGDLHMYGGIPVRLEIAARLLAGSISREKLPTSHVTRQCKYALELADLLIEAHNETCEAGE